MPLEKPKKGASKKERQAVASRNIAKEMKALEKSGKSKRAAQKQAIAIGLNSAGLSNRNRRKTRKK